MTDAESDPARTSQHLADVGEPLLAVPEDKELKDDSVHAGDWKYYKAQNKVRKHVFVLHSRYLVRISAAYRGFGLGSG